MFKDNTNKIVFIILSVIGLVSVLVTSYSFVNIDLYSNSKQTEANKLSSQFNENILLAATIDGEPVVEFPTIEDNYGVESVTCNNGVSASFNPVTWSVTVDGIVKSNTSCIVNFSSNISVDETSDALAMSKDELYAFYKGSFSGTATSSEILSGKTAYLNGVETIGTMPNNGAISKTITPSASAQTYTIPKGYHDGTGKVVVSSVKKPATVLSGSFSRTIGGYGTADVQVTFSPAFSKTPQFIYSFNENGHMSVQNLTVTNTGASFTLLHSKGNDTHSATVEWLAVVE